MAYKRCAVLLCLLPALCLIPFPCRATETSVPHILVNDNRTPAGKLENGVLTLHLELHEGLWHPESASGPTNKPGMPATIDTYAFAEEGHAAQTPGPLIRVPQGTEVRVSVHNLLSKVVFIHGLDQHPGSDDNNVIELAPGEAKQVGFNAGQPGSYLYWASTVNLPKQQQGPAGAIGTRPGEDGMMSGAFIVDPAGASANDRIMVIQVWGKDLYHPDFQGALTINGKSWPYTERLYATVGEPQHWRVLNATPLEHPMHLHGFYFHVTGVGNGGSESYYTAAEERMVNTESVLGGHTFDMTWTPDRIGNWIFHCHILDHMTSYLSPVLFGPTGPPPGLEQARMKYASDGMGMAELVMGITVSEPKGVKLAKLQQPVVGATEHLFVRERAASQHVPAGPGFYLAGESKSVGVIGPPLIVTQGVRTAITITNDLKEPTAIHWHGIEIESYYDGIPGWDGTPHHTTPMISAGGSFVAYMTPPRAGTFIYHTHMKDVEQLTGGMYGALLVMAPGQKYDPVRDRVFVLGREGSNELRDPLVVNGGAQPGAKFLLLAKSYRLRFINITPNDSPVELSLSRNGKAGQWRALAKDGADLPPQQAVMQEARVPLSVGETRDYEFAPKAPGEYVLRFLSRPFGNEVTQTFIVVPPQAPISVYADK